MDLENYITLIGLLARQAIRLVTFASFHLAISNLSENLLLQLLNLLKIDIIFTNKLVLLFHQWLFQINFAKGLNLVIFLFYLLKNYFTLWDLPFTKNKISRQAWRCIIRLKIFTNTSLRLGFYVLKYARQMAVILLL